MNILLLKGPIFSRIFCFEKLMANSVNYNKKNRPVNILYAIISTGTSVDAAMVSRTYAREEKNPYLNGFQ